MTETKSSAKPRITPIATDHKRLSQLACAASHTMPNVASELMDELDRAQVLANGRHAVDTVCMGCEVVYRTTRRVASRR